MANENNPFKERLVELTSIASDCSMITPSDSVSFPSIAIALRVATAGTLHIETVRGNDRTITVVDGEVLSVGVRKVFSTGTTATGILAYYL